MTMNLKETVLEMNMSLDRLLDMLNELIRCLWFGDKGQGDGDLCLVNVAS